MLYSCEIMIAKALPRALVILPNELAEDLGAGLRVAVKEKRDRILVTLEYTGVRSVERRRLKPIDGHFAIRGPRLLSPRLPNPRRCGPDL